MEHQESADCPIHSGSAVDLTVTTFLPEAVFSIEDTEDRRGPVRILVCKDKVCARPAGSAEEALERVREVR